MPKVVEKVPATKPRQLSETKVTATKSRGLATGRENPAAHPSLIGRNVPHPHVAWGKR